MKKIKWLLLPILLFIVLVSSVMMVGCTTTKDPSGSTPDNAVSFKSLQLGRDKTAVNNRTVNKTRSYSSSVLKTSALTTGDTPEVLPEPEITPDPLAPGNEDRFFAVAGDFVYIVINLNVPAGYDIQGFTMNDDFRIINRDAVFGSLDKYKLVLKSEAKTVAGEYPYVLNSITYANSENTGMKVEINKTVHANVFGWKDVEFFDGYTTPAVPFKTIQVVDGRELLTESNPYKDIEYSRAGYKFMGWKIKDSVETFMLPQTVNADVQLEAVWEILPAFANINNGSIQSDHVYGEPITFNLRPSGDEYKNISYRVKDGDTLPTGLTLTDAVISGNIVADVGVYMFNMIASSSISGMPTVNREFKIAVTKATPVITTWPTASGITYSAMLSTSTLTGGVASVPGIFSWNNGYWNTDVIPPCENSGYDVKFTPTDSVNYESVNNPNKTAVIVAKAETSEPTDTIYARITAENEISLYSGFQFRDGHGGSLEILKVDKNSFMFNNNGLSENHENYRVYEFSTDNINWQLTSEFQKSNSSDQTFYVRIKESANYKASPSISEARGTELTLDDMYWFDTEEFRIKGKFHPGDAEGEVRLLSLTDYGRTFKELPEGLGIQDIPGLKHIGAYTKNTDFSVFGDSELTKLSILDAELKIASWALHSMYKLEEMILPYLGGYYLNEYTNLENYEAMGLPRVASGAGYTPIPYLKKLTILTGNITGAAFAEISPYKIFPNLIEIILGETIKPPDTSRCFDNRVLTKLHFMGTEEKWNELIKYSGDNFSIIIPTGVTFGPII